MGICASCLGYRRRDYNDVSGLFARVLLGAALRCDTLGIALPLEMTTRKERTPANAK